MPLKSIGLKHMLKGKNRFKNFTTFFPELGPET